MATPPPWAELLADPPFLLGVFDHLVTRHRDLELAAGRVFSLTLRRELTGVVAGQPLRAWRCIELRTRTNPERNILMVLDGDELTVISQRPIARLIDHRRLDLNDPASFGRLERVIVELLLPKRRRPRR
jgi:hypothetical protein